MPKSPSPPVADVRPHQLTVHGHTRVDDYYWLREKASPEVIAYLEAENAYTQAMSRHIEPLRESIFRELVGRIQESDSTAPIQSGGYHYYSRTEEGKQYSIYCRKRTGTDVPEEILIDLNQIAEKYDYLRLGIYEVSPDHNLLAYSLDTDGAENYVVYFKDLATGELLPDQLSETSYALEWANDCRTVFYTTQDDAKRSYKCFRHVLGTDPQDDELIYHEQDKRYSVYLDKTKDDAFLFLILNSIESTEYRYLKADAPSSDFVTLFPRQKNVRYSVDHHTGTFYIVTNDNATNNRVMATPVGEPSKESWQELIPNRPQVKVDDIELFKDHLVIYERENGLRTMQIIELSDWDSHAIVFREPVYTYAKGENPNFDSNVLRFNYMSLTTPDTDYDYDMYSREWTLVKRKPVLGGYDPADYQSERVFATATDGTKVPISLVYRKGMARDGKSPCLLYGYGSYGSNMDPAFNANRLALLDRGIIYAIAHIRGGEEMGRHWYDQGKFLNKKNTFTDFIACAHHLIGYGYTSRENLAIMGRSAGGLLIGAVLTMAPDLFKVAVAGVPFVDVVSTMLDESIPLTVGEFEEWGNPKDKAYYEYMLSYSPYDNTVEQAYPHLLITAGLNDPRVQYWEPAKWTAKLRQLKTDDNVLLLKTFMGAGHFSSSGRYDNLKDLAFDYAFILDRLGLNAQI
jgi:oligopeptidase B